jgi:hypothetical protein
MNLVPTTLRRGTNYHLHIFKRRSEWDAFFLLFLFIVPPLFSKGDARRAGGLFSSTRGYSKGVPMGQPLVLKSRIYFINFFKTSKSSGVVILILSAGPSIIFTLYPDDSTIEDSSVKVPINLTSLTFLYELFNIL